MRITWWPAHCLYWAFNAFPSLPQSSLFKILPTSAASQGRPSCLPCDLQLWFFLLHFLPVVFQSNTKISLGQDQAWIYSRDCLCQFCIWVRFPCLVLLAPVLTLVAWFLIAPFCSHSECLLSLWHLICDEPNHFWNGGFTFQQRYSWASNHGSYHQSHWAIPFKPGSNSDLKSHKIRRNVSWVSLLLSPLLLHLWGICPPSPPPFSEPKWKKASTNQSREEKAMIRLASVKGQIHPKI